MLATKDVYDDFLEAEQMYLVDGVHQQDPADDAAATSDTQSQEVIVRTRGDEYFTWSLHMPLIAPHLGGDIF